MTKTLKLLRALEESAETALQLRDEYEGPDNLHRERLSFYAATISRVSRMAHRELDDQTERIGA